MASMLSVADPRAPSQLIEGFSPLTNDRRWTGRRFSARLKTPKNAAQRGAVLELTFGLPDTSLARLHSIGLSASVNGVALAPERYSTAGDFTYSRDVPPAALQDFAAVAIFTLDRVLPPSGQEARELGLSVSAVGFEAK
jgi:hypothetical protein